MATDKKITELAPIAILAGNETGVLASGGWDYQFTLSTLLQYIGKNLNTKASTSFGSVLPQNISGENGDLFINTANNSFAQKTNGQWIVKYQFQTSYADTLFGPGIPANTAGNNGDVYISTASGIFYKKTNGSWVPAFSMQTGPPGPPGVKGDTGTPGLNGCSVLSGMYNPSNLYTGTDGDFYINTSTWTIFGPKANGVWAVGAQIETIPQPIKIEITAGITNCPLLYSYDGRIGDNPNPRIKLKNADGSFSYDNTVAIDQSADGSVLTITGMPDGNGKFLSDYEVILYPGGSIDPPALSQSALENSFPFTLPYTLQT